MTIYIDIYTHMCYIIYSIHAIHVYIYIYTIIMKIIINNNNDNDSSTNNDTMRGAAATAASSGGTCPRPRIITSSINISIISSIHM